MAGNAHKWRAKHRPSPKHPAGCQYCAAGRPKRWKGKGLKNKTGHRHNPGK